MFTPLITHDLDGAALPAGSPGAITVGLSPVRNVGEGLLEQLLAERGVTLETALTSNVQTAASPSLAEHQVHALLSAGVPVTLNTDNPTTSATDLRYEYRHGAVEAGLSPELLDLVARNAAQAAFTEAGRGLADF